MKCTTSGYAKCLEAIKDAILEEPIRSEPFTIYFDNEKLESVKAEYGYDLYACCLKDVKEQMRFND